MTNEETQHDAPPPGDCISTEDVRESSVICWDIHQNPQSLPAMVGRETEHDHVKRFLTSRLAVQHEKVLLICGPCGVGKSSTVHGLLPQGEIPLHCQVSVQCKGTHYVDVIRPMKALHVNCTDLSSAQLLEALTTRLMYKQRKSKVLDAKAALLRFACTARQDRQLDCAIAGAPTANSLTVNEWNQSPLHVMVLDEVDACKARTNRALQNLLRIATECPLWFALIIVSNNRWPAFLPPDNPSMRSRIDVLTFTTYNTATLARIGAAAVAQRTVTDTSISFVVAPAAATLAAKSSALGHYGDARKVKEFCQGAVAVAKSALQDVSNASQRSGTKRGRAHEPVVVTVTAKDMHAVTSGPATTVEQSVLQLPELTTYVLCCIVVAARRKVMRDFLLRTSVAQPTAGSNRPPTLDLTGALSHSNTVAMCDTGELDERTVHRLYIRLMARLLFPPATAEAVKRSLEDLSARRVISRSDRFVCTGEWPLEEIENALVAKGTELVRKEDEVSVGDSGLAPPKNRFADALRELATS